MKIIDNDVLKVNEENVAKVAKVFTREMAYECV